MSFDIPVVVIDEHTPFPEDLSEVEEVVGGEQA